MKIIQNYNSKAKTLIFLTLAFAFLLFTFYFNHSASADASGTCTTPSGTAPPIVAGLTTLSTAPKLNQNLVTSSGYCVVNNPKAALAPYKIPTYEDLKSFYFTQKSGGQTVSKGEATENDVRLTSESKYYVTGNLTIASNIPGNKTGVIFVDGNLFINPQNGKLTSPPPNTDSGLVFIVKGNVNIYQNVSQIDAVIISEGIICTNYDGATCPPNNTLAPPLEINGSLISLNETNPIQFRRTLNPSLSSNNRNTPAEQINYDPKYLVILRDLMSDTFQKWSETQ